ncbi:MAG: hypothetical protein Rubg2KO_40220 [Rubricoccaceae bacterium]
MTCPLGTRSLLASSFVLLLFLGSVREAHAQLPASEARFPAEVDSVEIPFSIHHGFLVVTVELDGVRPLELVVDTGAPVMVLTDTSLAQHLTYQVIAQAQVDGSGSEAMKTAPLVSGLSPRVGGVELSGGLVLLGGGFHHVLMGLDGIIGASLFEDAVVRVDPERQQLTLIRPEVFDPSPSRLSIPLVRQPNGHVHTTLKWELGGQAFTTERVLVDTGALQSLSLYVPESTEIAWPDSMLHDTVIAWGSRGPVQGDVVRVDTVWLGEHRLPGVVATLRKPEAGDLEEANLGIDVLLLFKSVFDYGRGRLHLWPIEGMAPPDPWTVGLTVEPPANSQPTAMTIGDVLLGSPAAEAGLQRGDQILEVNGVSMPDLIQGGNARGFLRTEPGAPLRLRVQRGADELVTTVRPRRLI